MNATLLRDLGACRESRRWARNFASPQVAWSACVDGAWVAWLIGRLACGKADGSPEHRLAVRVSLVCARSVSHLIPEAERTLLATQAEVLDRWVAGDDSIDRPTVRRAIYDIRRKLYAAPSAAYAAYAADAAADAAYAVAHAAAYAAAAAADAAYAVAHAAAYAAAAAPSAAYAAYAAAAAADAAYAARKKHLADLAVEIRKIVPRCPVGVQ